MQVACRGDDGPVITHVDVKELLDGVHHSTMKRECDGYSDAGNDVMFGGESVIDQRVAGCFGFTLGMDITERTASPHRGNDHCVCAYDLEVSFDKNTLA